jgi:hypothetical protein
MGSGGPRTCTRRFEAQSLQGHESQPEPKALKNRPTPRYLSVLPGYTTAPVYPPVETR